MAATSSRETGEPVTGPAFSDFNEQSHFHSLDLNPIEQIFAKIKHWMRAAQKRPAEDTWRQIGALVVTIDPDACSNSIANASYASIKV